MTPYLLHSLKNAVPANVLFLVLAFSFLNVFDLWDSLNGFLHYVCYLDIFFLETMYQDLCYTYLVKLALTRKSPPPLEYTYDTLTYDVGVSV